MHDAHVTGGVSKQYNTLTLGSNHTKATKPREDTH